MIVTYCSHCGGTNIHQDANLVVNTGEYNTYDNMSCEDCGYDGYGFEQTDVPDDFEVGTKITLEPSHD